MQLFRETVSSIGIYRNSWGVFNKGAERKSILEH